VVTADFSALEAAARERVGVRLFTVLAWDDDRGALRRIHTSHPVQYPTGGEKAFPREAPWIRRVVVQQQPYLGRDRTAVAAVFDDHELIASLGCGAVVNVPVVDGGRTLGVLNLLDAEGAYTDDSVTAALPLAGLVVEPLRRWHAAQGAAGSGAARS
jgi:GAF domain-containing protein